MDLTVVDSFTDQPVAGNPAAIAVVDAFPDEARMQSIAREMNLSETAFVVPRADGSYDLRWFTPEVEVDLCGHATLAAAHVLGGTGTFHTRSGELMCTPGGDGWIEMDFPADIPVTEPAPPTIAATLGLVAGADAGAGAVPDHGSAVRAFTRTRADVLVEVAGADIVRALRPDLGAVAALQSRCVIVTATGDRPGIDCVSRVFAPNAGIAEDPVTGSAHCALAEYWGERLGRDTLVGEQASARGGVVRMTRKPGRVVLSGQAVTVSRVHLVV
jgi:predicted PhzF superfamily epimerase YddE/YHI9